MKLDVTIKAPSIKEAFRISANNYDDALRTVDHYISQVHKKTPKEQFSIAFTPTRK